MKRIYFWAAVCALITAILIIPAIFIEIFIYLYPESQTLNMASLAMTLISLPLSVAVLLGYLVLADEQKEKCLRRISWALMALTFLFVAITTVSAFYPNRTIDIVTIGLIVLMGIAEIIFGYRLSKVQVQRSRGVGIMYVIQGIATASVILILILPIISIIVSVMEARLFFSLIGGKHEEVEMPKMRKHKGRPGKHKGRKGLQVKPDLV
jgi:hypothetical protein